MTRQSNFHPEEGIDDDIDFSGTADDVRQSQKAIEIDRAANAQRTSINVAECRRLLGELSDNQREAAATRSKNVLLIAPAGTGKTRTIGGRVAQSLIDGISPEDIMVCTYTTAAAHELIDRLKPMMKVKISDLWIGTIHSIALRILRANAELLGISQNHSIIDTAQQKLVVRQKMIDLRHPASDGPDASMMVARILGFIHDAKNRMISPRDAIDAFEAGRLDWATGIGEAEIAVYSGYEAYTRMYDMIDFSDMLYLPTQLIENNAEIRRIWQQRFKMVIVDEYQDVASAQVRFIRNLVGPDTAFFVAADDDQAIYSWRGSELRNVLEFSRYWKDPEIVTLRYNYRTPKSIFRVAGKLITNNPGRYDKKIETRDDAKAIVRAVACPDAVTERQRILENVKSCHEDMGIPLEDMAVIGRTNRVCNEIATFLSANGVEVNLQQPLPLHTAAVSSLIAWVQATQDIDNPLVFDRMVTFPERIFDERMINQITQKVTRGNEETPRNKRGPIAYLREMKKLGKIPEGSMADEFLQRIDKLRKVIDANPTNPFAEAATSLGILDIVRVSSNPDDQLFMPFVKLVDDLASEIAEDRDDKSLDLASVLASINSLDINEGRNGIHIMTMHGAKGLEFEAVFAPGWEEGEFPSRMRTDELSFEEERRLAYVTITRARRFLMVTWAGNRRGHVRPSTFLSEMGVLDQ